jgi:hypothetical protein
MLLILHIDITVLNIAMEIGTKCQFLKNWISFIKLNAEPCARDADVVEQPSISLSV